MQSTVSSKTDAFFKALSAVKVENVNPLEFGLDDNFISFTIVDGWIGIAELENGNLQVWQCKSFPGDFYEPPSEDWDVVQDIPAMMHRKDVLFAALKVVLDMLMDQSMYFVLLDDDEKENV